MSEFQKTDNLRKSLDNSHDRPSQIKILSEYILDHMKATKPASSKSTREILDVYKSLRDVYPDFIPDIPDNTFIVLLSKVSGEQNSRINCPGRKQGYYLEQLVEKIEKIESTEEKCGEEQQAIRVEQAIREKDLYFKLKQWLFEKDFDRVSDTSTLKTNGKWGNPDIVGLKIEDIYGRPDIEITTIEAKLTNDNWEEWIFEAVAHTRFANRSYFAFIYPEDLVNKLDSTELKLYAEHFRIGVLILVVTGEDYIKIKSRQPANIDFDNIKVVEYFQAPFNQTHIKFRKKFLHALDILDLKRLYAFGEELN